jgi:hypothetical protein
MVASSSRASAVLGFNITKSAVGPEAHERERWYRYRPHPERSAERFTIGPDCGASKSPVWFQSKGTLLALLGSGDQDVHGAAQAAERWDAAGVLFAEGGEVATRGRRG